MNFFREKQLDGFKGKWKWGQELWALVVLFLFLLAILEGIRLII